MPAQETEGLLSPWIRNIRLKKVASQIKPGSSLLDLGCGLGFLADFLPATCDYYGVDRLPFERKWEPGDLESVKGSRQRNFFNEDLLSESAVERIQAWLPGKVDYIAVIAFLEHLKKPARLLKGYMPLLNSGGCIVGTTPHPRGRKVHDTLARMYLCSRAGAEEHEDFLGRAELKEVGKEVGAELIACPQFLWGLNQLFVFQAQ